MKTAIVLKRDRVDNTQLLQITEENDKLTHENNNLKQAMQHVVCPSCDHTFSIDK